MLCCWQIIKTSGGERPSPMDADTNDSVSAIHAGELALNGVVKPEDLQTAIINKVLIFVLVHEAIVL